MIEYLSQKLTGIGISLEYEFLKTGAVLVVNLTKSGYTKSQFLSQAVPVLRDFMVQAGISMEFYDFKELYYYYRLARFALEHGKKKTPSLWYFQAEQYILDYYMVQCIKDQNVYALMPPGLKKLVQYDKAHDTQYVHLLQTYLECNQNIEKTIRLEYMHRSTFLYQIDKIKNILGMDLEQPDICLTLRISLKLMENSPKQITL